MLSWQWDDFLSWGALGAVVGFLLAWRRLKANSESAISATERNEELDEKERKATVRYLKGARIGRCTFFAAYGACVGAFVYFLWMLVFWLIGQA